MSNLRMFFEPANIENFSINAFVLNVSDKEYAPMVINSGLTGGTTKAFGAPRTWGGEIRFTN